MPKKGGCRVHVPCPPDVPIEVITLDANGKGSSTSEPDVIRKRLEEALGEAQRVSGCQSTIVARQDGLVIAHRTGQDHDPHLASAMTAAIFGTAAFAAEDLGQGVVERIVIECSDGKIVAMSAGREAIIVGLYRKDTNLGLLLHGLTTAAEIIARVLTESHI